MGCNLNAIGFSLALALLSGGAAAAGQIHTYQGMCNASAAVDIGRGRFVVADDETNVLRLYSVGKPDPTPVPFYTFLDTKPDKESDLEGAALLGGDIYWISSHGTNKTGEVQERRYRFFATTNGSDGKIKPINKQPNTKLIDQLTGPALAAFQLKLASTLPPKQAGTPAKDGRPETPGGLNIEGLAAYKADQLLIGFRNPIPGGRALVVPLTNPRAVSKGAAAVFGPAVLVPLGGRGIRSLEKVGDGYLIVAGAVDDRADFALYGWSGPEKNQVTRYDGAVLQGLSVEALFTVGDNIYVLSDDGKMGGVDCEARTSKTFRGLMFKRSDLKPAPVAH